MDHVIETKPEPQFILNDEFISLNTCHPHQTLLQFLRTCKNLTGTKEGCAEGDCGACTVILVDVQDGRLVFRSATSCILFLGSLSNRAVITIEFLSRQSDPIQVEAHPLQRMFIEQHASQCGFCTPGFIMSAAAHRFQTVYEPPSGSVPGDLEYSDISEIIAGNLCRCTGYGPIVKAIQRSQDLAEPFWMRERLDGIKKKLLRLQDDPIPDQKIVFTGKDRAVSHIPVTEGELGDLRERFPGSRLVAGATDLGLWATKKWTRWEHLIHLQRIPELKKITHTEDALWVGAGVTLTEVTETLVRYQPHLVSYLKRFAATQIRNTGTIGGNIANGSPIGDLPPLLIALGATLILKKKWGGELTSRRVKIEDYFLDYGKQWMEPGEWISGIRIPLEPLRSGQVRAYKISKRLEQDISIVSLGIYCERKDNKIDTIILAYGGMAGIPKRAAKTEAALQGREFTLENLQSASRFLEKDYQPLSDHRGRMDYRLEAAKGLLIRYYYDLEGGYRDLYSREFFEKKCYRDTTLPPSPPVDNRGSSNSYSCVGKPLTHDSALLHVTGKAIYTDDLPVFEGTLHMALIPSPVARGKLDEGFVAMLRNQDRSEAIVSWLDIPGNNTISHAEKETLFSDGELQFLGQPLAAVLAETHEGAKRWVQELIPAFSAHCRKTDPPILTIDEALEKKSFISPSVTLEKTPKDKSIEELIQSSSHRVQGTFSLGGQDHFYLEGQVAYAKSEEDGGMTVYSSTQHPSEVQHIVAGILGVDYHRVRVVVRRMGGGFGGKESQANFVAAAAALGAFKTKRPVKLRLDRDDDMIMTGKRHDFRFDYEVGFDGEGNIQALSVVQSVRCGYSLDLSLPVAGRALCHADSAYYLPYYKIISHRLKTHTVSNTAFRGFGGPQGMIGMERIIDHISFELALDPVEVRKRNLYDPQGQEGKRCFTPYGMKVEDNILPPMIEKLLVDSNYYSRRQEILEWNRSSPVYKRGLGFNPVKFGISFNVSFLNQAGALVHIYKDGSVKINHGGTEMGQGLMIKCAQVAAERLQLPLDRIQITATDTDKVPNTSATAASSGSDLNGMAIADACDILRSRLNRVFLEQLADSQKRGDENIIWKNGEIHCSGEKITFTDLVKRAYLSRVSLSSTGYYRTPKIHWDIKKFKGRPFYYFAYGVAISEVIIDTLTGESRPLRADLLHDVGHSLNPSIDQGQIEGGYIQGMGWLTSEELYWDKEGRFMTHAPSTYKIPTSFDKPEIHLSLYQSRSQEGGGNPEPTIYRSKAVGEPPLMLAISHFLAIRDAIAAVRDHKVYPDLNAPATPQEILFTLRRIS